MRNKSLELTTMAVGVLTVMRPDVAPIGIVVVRLVVEPAVTQTGNRRSLNLIRWLAKIGSKLSPLIVKLVIDPIADCCAITGLKFEMKGKVEAIVNDSSLVAVPAGVVTATDPVVAPLGTVVIIWVGVEDITVAGTPLNVTVFWLGVVLKPVP